MKTQTSFAIAALGILLIPAAAARAQTATGTLNVALTNTSALVLLFKSDSTGTKLTNANTSNATIDFGTVADYETPKAGVTETSGSSSFSVSSPFAVYVEVGGSTSASYTLTAALDSAPPTGLSVEMDSTELTTVPQIFSTSSTYFLAMTHTVGLIVSTAPSGSGGPATGTQLTSTIDVTATAN